MPTAPAASTPRAVSAAASGLAPYPPSTSAETGRSTAAAIRRTMSSISSREMRCPSGYPSANATPALEVAIARAPVPPISIALATSQALGRMRRVGPEWRLRRVWALARCASMEAQGNPPASRRNAMPTPGSSISVQLLEIGDLVAQRLRLARSRGIRRGIEWQRNRRRIHETAIGVPAGVSEQDRNRGDEHETCRHLPTSQGAHGVPSAGRQEQDVYQRRSPAPERGSPVSQRLALWRH